MPVSIHGSCSKLYLRVPPHSCVLTFQWVLRTCLEMQMTSVRMRRNARKMTGVRAPVLDPVPGQGRAQGPGPGHAPGHLVHRGSLYQM